MLALRWVAAFVLAAASGCYVEARIRGDVVGTSSGSAVGGPMAGGEICVGAQLAFDDPDYAAAPGAVGTRSLTASSGTAIDHRNAPGIALGALLPSPGFLSDVARGTAMRLDVVGWNGSTVNVSDVRLDAAGRFGWRHVELELGPSLSWWDAGRGGTALGAGAEVAVRLFADPR